MNRRDLLKKSALVGAGLALAKSGKRVAWALAGPTPLPTTQQTQVSQGVERRHGAVDPQLSVVAMSGAEFQHPKHIRAPKDGVLYANTVVRFAENGSVSFANGRTLSAEKGASFKLKVFSDRSGTVVRKLLVRGRNKEAALARGAARKVARLALKGRR